MAFCARSRTSASSSSGADGGGGIIIIIMPVGTSLALKASIAAMAGVLTGALYQKNHICSTAMFEGILYFCYSLFERIPFLFFCQNHGLMGYSRVC